MPLLSEWQPLQRLSTLAVCSQIDGADSGMIIKRVPRAARGYNRQQWHWKLWWPHRSGVQFSWSRGQLLDLYAPPSPHPRICLWTPMRKQSSPCFVFKRSWVQANVWFTSAFCRPLWIIAWSVKSSTWAVTLKLTESLTTQATNFRISSAHTLLLRKDTRNRDTWYVFSETTVRLIEDRTKLNQRETSKLS